MYFVRTQLAHLHEGLKVIDKIKADPLLMSIVRQCDQQTQNDFNTLKEFLTGGNNYSEFENLIGQLRHNLTFHYHQCGKLICRAAIDDRASRKEARISSITRGNTTHLWYFKIADDVVDSIVVRQIWKIPREKNGRVETNKILERVRQICIWFLDFSAELIWQYCKSQ